MKLGHPVFRATRFASNPLLAISTDTNLSFGDRNIYNRHGTWALNINGPSVVRVPDWVESKLGKYYMYFAHHMGSHIRMAYADAVDGPWRVFSPGSGVMRRAENPGCRSHIASPDVHVVGNEFIMYFHDTKGHGITHIARSEDGLNFTADCTRSLGPFYWAAFEHRHEWYALAKNGSSGGILYKSPNGVDFEKGPGALPNMRHAAVFKINADADEAYAIFSRIGDTPEHLRISKMTFDNGWPIIDDDGQELLLPDPTVAYEGKGHPTTSKEGAAHAGRLELRDPAVFVDDDGSIFLFYAGGGETGIAGARLKLE